MGPTKRSYGELSKQEPLLFLHSSSRFPFIADLHMQQNEVVESGSAKMGTSNDLFLLLSCKNPMQIKKLSLYQGNG